MAMPDKSSITTEQQMLFWLIGQQNPKLETIEPTDMVIKSIETTSNAEHGNSKAVVAFKGGADEQVNYNRVGLAVIGETTGIVAEVEHDQWTEAAVVAAAKAAVAAWFVSHKVIVPEVLDAEVYAPPIEASTTSSIGVNLGASTVHVVGSLTVNVTRKADAWIVDPNLLGFTVEQLTIE